MKLFYQIIGLALSSILTSGCQILEPYTDESQPSNTGQNNPKYSADNMHVNARSFPEKFASQKSERATAGNYTNQQESRLKIKLRNSGIQVYRIGNEIRLLIPSFVAFDTGFYEIKRSFYPAMSLMVNILKDYYSNFIEIRGYTDTAMLADHPDGNWLLSQERANSIAHYLVNSQINPARLSAYGFGPENPIGDNSTKEGRALNRRIEIIIHPASAPRR